MSDFLLELRSEEIPARMQAGARASLEKLFREQLSAAGISLGGLTVWSTPRRLVLIAPGLPLATEAVSEELKGPKTSAPPQALEGFLRKTGLTQDQLTERDGIYYAISEKPGRATTEVLARAIPHLIRQFPWPKSMRWGAPSITTASLRWVRPLSGIIAILGDEVVDFEIPSHVDVFANAAGKAELRPVSTGIKAGRTTLGHRFHHPGEITIGGASDYQEKLRACHVIVDHAERQDLIRAKAAAAASAAGLTLVADEGLVIENAGLTEWPVPLLGLFDEDFLEVPPETIQLTARTNQKYFVCESDGKLANAFVCTANIEASDGGLGIVAGNRKVLAARLSDARFFWQQDRKKALADHAKGLERITFHEKLGTVSDKVERVAKLARWLAEEGIVKGADPDLTEQAARLAKADLVTEMVGEFPELQGLMGGYYARAEGLPNALADAIRDHYKPVGQGDEVPAAPVTVAVSLADKLDTLVSFFAIDEKPTGSKDPFALRRAALGILSLILQNDLRFSLIKAIARSAYEISFWMGYRDASDGALQTWETLVRHSGDLEIARKHFNEYLADPKLAESIGRKGESGSEVPNELLGFLADRLKVQQKEAGVRHDLIDAVFALGGEDDLVRLLARVNALQAFVGTEDGTNLLAGYKRAANILKKEDWRGVEGEIAHTGEEDPLSQVDDPDLAPVIAAKLAERHERVLSYTPEPAEKALMDALDSAGPEAAAAVRTEDFARAMAALASLRVPIDAFFDSVTVNDADKDKRGARLDLLAQFRKSVHQVADFSKIEG